MDLKLMSRAPQTSDNRRHNQQSASTSQLVVRDYLENLLSKMQMIRLCIFLSALVSADAFAVRQTGSAQRFDTSCHALTVPGMWGGGLNYGKGDFIFYSSFEGFMGKFIAEDRVAFPDIFNIPKGAYEVSLSTPLGIIFEEIEVGKGVYVQELVEGGLAERRGKIQPGDVLVGVTAVKVVGAKWEVRDTERSC
jgi:hypothetical protein